MTTEIGNSTLIRTWANSGDILNPGNSKIDAGWLSGEQPPNQWMNFIHNQQQQKINHILSRGISDWNNVTTYLVGASVNRNGVAWLALNNNTDSPPSDGNTNWTRLKAGAPGSITASTTNNDTGTTHTHELPDSAVHSLYASIAFGAVGSYTIANRGSTNMTPGQTVAGSSLSQAGVSAVIGGDASVEVKSPPAVYSGTWVLMSFLPTSSAIRTALFLRRT